MAKKTTKEKKYYTWEELAKKIGETQSVDMDFIIGTIAYIVLSIILVTFVGWEMLNGILILWVVGLVVYIAYKIKEKNIRKEKKRR